MSVDCQDCGVCCTSQLETYVRVTGDDYTRLGDAADALTHFVGNRCYMRMTSKGQCVALERSGGRYACRIYERRPALCRELERGSPACEAERERKGEVRGLRLPVLDARL